MSGRISTRLAAPAIGLCLTVVISLVAALGAGAAASPVYPASGDVVTTTKPVFKWTKPPDENIVTASVASSPETNATGEFLTQNVIDLGALQAWNVQWTPLRPLFAGNYWWHVASKNPDLKGYQWSEITAFSVAQKVSIKSLAIKPYPGTHSMMVTVKWSTSVRNLTLTERVLKGSRQVFSHRTAVKDSDVDGLNVAAADAAVLPQAGLLDQAHRDADRRQGEGHEVARTALSLSRFGATPERSE